MNTKTDTATPGSPLVEDIRVAMRKAFSFGQTYWQQADSESVSENAKSDETSKKFSKLVTDTCTALAAGIAQPSAPNGWDLAIRKAAVICRNSAEAYERRGRHSGIGWQVSVYLEREILSLKGSEISTAPDVPQPVPSDAAPASTLTQSRDREPWTDEQRENHRKNKALVYSCTICCARKGEPHLPSCPEGPGICGVSTQDA